MSRHNRRRTRGGHKAKHIRAHADSYDSALNITDGSLLPATALFQPWPSSNGRTNTAGQRGSLVSASGYPTAGPCDLAAAYRLGGSAVTPATSRHWTNRYLAWQAREAENRRMFGEADGSGEDEGLCMKMMEYFGKLDFIDP